MTDIKKFARKIKYIINIAFAIAVVVVVYKARIILYDVDLPGKSFDLQADGQNIDVLMLGTSHLSIIQPCEMWRRQGIAAYNLYNDGNSMARNLATLRLALQYCSPKLVVLDMEHWWSGANLDTEIGTFHHALDNYPLNGEKKEVVYDAFPQKKIRQEMLFPLFRYHDRWQGLDQDDFDKFEDYLMGANLRFGSNSIANDYELAFDRIDYSQDISEVQAIIDECKSRGINVLLLCLPYVANEVEQATQNYGYILAADNDLEYINLVNQAGIVNFECDFIDEGHMNFSGGIKCADYLGEYIRLNYDIPDRREDDEYCSVWNKKLEKYEKRLDSLLSKSKDIHDIISFMNSDSYNGELFALDASDDISESSKLLLCSVNIDGEYLSRLQEAIDNQEAYYVYVDRQNRTIKEYTGDEALQNRHVECDYMYGYLYNPRTDGEALVCY